MVTRSMNTGPLTFLFGRSFRSLVAHINKQTQCSLGCLAGHRSEARSIGGHFWTIGYTMLSIGVNEFARKPITRMLACCAPRSLGSWGCLVARSLGYYLLLAWIEAILLGPRLEAFRTYKAKRGNTSCFGNLSFHCSLQNRNSESVLRICYALFPMAF